jgi:2,3-bisphosphoglycerate-independent phosphoglycerate mutase
VGKLLDELPSFNDYSLAILPDHPTPITIKTHTSDPVPYSMCSTSNSSDDIMKYDEYSASTGSMSITPGHEFIKSFIQYSRK